MWEGGAAKTSLRYCTCQPWRNRPCTALSLSSSSLWRSTIKVKVNFPRPFPRVLLGLLDRTSPSRPCSAVVSTEHGTPWDCALLPRGPPCIPQLMAGRRGGGRCATSTVAKQRILVRAACPSSSVLLCYGENHVWLGKSATASIHQGRAGYMILNTDSKGMLCER